MFIVTYLLLFEIANSLYFTRKLNYSVDNQTQWMSRRLLDLYLVDFQELVGLLSMKRTRY